MHMLIGCLAVVFGSAVPVNTNVTSVAPAGETAMLQSKIDAAWRAGGGRVVVPSGIHRIGGLRLRSNVELHLAPNAVLSASRNCDDYDVLANDALEPIALDLLVEARSFKLHVRDRMKPWAGASNPAIRWNNGILRLVGATNVVISGEAGSAIEGNNSYDPEGEEHYRGVHGISAFYSSNVVVRGVELRHTGNWATRFAHCADLMFADLSIRGGHDGVHVRGCDQVKILRCDIRCGDDAVAGFDNKDVTVEDCSLNTACSAFRFGGTHVRVRRCRIWGPAEWPFRCGLTVEEKRAGVSSQGRGRPNMLSFWTYFADFSQPIRNPPGDIVISDCTVENADRFLHYNFSGNETWQKGSPLGDIRFERVRASGIGMSLCAYASEKRPLALELKDCEIAFAKPQSEFVRAAFVDRVRLEGVVVRGVEGPCVRTWSGVPKIEARDLKGIRPEVVTSTDKFSTESI